MLKGSILQKTWQFFFSIFLNHDIFNVYVFNKAASKCIRWNLIELRGEIEESTTVFGDFNTFQEYMDPNSRKLEMT